MDTSLRFIHITDTHIGATADYTLFSQPTLPAAQAVVKVVNETLSPDFILHTGDVTYDPDVAATELAQQTFGAFKQPVYYVRGNHDNPDSMRQLLPNLPDGTGRIDYDFVMNDFHFIVLDTFGHTQPAGFLELYQLEWLAATCANSTAQSLVVALHHLPVLTGIGWYDKEMVIENHDALFDSLKPYRERLRGLFFGHIHRASSTFRDGILCSSAAATGLQYYGWPEQPEPIAEPTALGGFSVVTLTHTQTWVTHHTLPRSQSIEE